MSIIELNDEELVILAKEGDQEAYQLLWERCHGPIIGFLNKRLAYGDPLVGESIEDVTQEIFMRAFTKLDERQGEGKFFSWLMQIAKNYSANVWRDVKTHDRIQKEKAFPLEIAEQTLAENPIDIVQNKFQSEVIWKIINSMESDLNKKIAKMRYKDDLTIKKIGIILDITDQAVAHRLRRIQKELAKSEELKAYHAGG